jgi:hypothetical protein
VRREETRNAYKTFIVNPHEKKIHGQFRNRRKDNIKLELKEMEDTSVNCTKVDKKRI